MMEMLLIPALPLLMLVGLLLVAPASLALSERPRATVIMLTVLMLGCLFSLLMIRWQVGGDRLTASRIAATALVMLVAGLSAAPLLGRGRAGGIILASITAGVFTVPLFLHGLLPMLPPLSGVTLLVAMLIVGTLTGIGGSMQLPMSRTRFTGEGVRRALVVNESRIAGGWLVLAGGLVVLSSSMQPPDRPLMLLPLLVSGLTAGFLQLAEACGDALAKAGKGFAAGIIIALMGRFTPDVALVAGLTAGFSVMRADAILSALRIDDAPHLVSVVLIPALLGLLAPALLGEADFGATISWLAVAGGFGILVPLLLWPLVKLTIGFATR